MEGVGVAFDVFRIDDVLVVGLTRCFLIGIGIESAKLPVQIRSTERDRSKERPDNEGHDQDHIQQHPDPRIPPVDKIQYDIGSQQ